MRRWAGLVLVMTATALLGAACGSAAPSASNGAAQGGLTRNRAPLPAGKHPSEIAKMVCQAKAQRELAEVLGVTPVTVTNPTWVSHLYSCRYQYKVGSFTLSVQELSSWDQTTAYFKSLGRQLGDTGKIGGLGQGAFATTDGSVVVRKDWKVLLVDAAGLPAQFGVPQTSAADVAISIADVILGCWSGD